MDGKNGAAKEAAGELLGNLVESVVGGLAGRDAFLGGQVVDAGGQGDDGFLNFQLIHDFDTLFGEVQQLELERVLAHTDLGIPVDGVGVLGPVGALGTGFKSLDRAYVIIMVLKVDLFHFLSSNNNCRFLLSFPWFSRAGRALKPLPH